MAKGGVGFYGKLPIVGDFITRRLPKDFINALDQWMQSGVSVSKEELGAQWLDLYLTSPIWRFAFQPGICGESAWVGIMMPSVDKVGRYYPMVLACQIDEPNRLPFILSDCSDWFIRLEEIALAGLEESYNLEGFDEAVLGLEGPSSIKKLSAINPESNDQLSTHMVSNIEVDESAAINESFMLAATLAMSKNGDRFSLWLSVGQDSEKGSIKLFKGLPTGHDYSGMIA